ncbi:MAG: hypothetical protein ACYSVY_18545 [Planctomycetota bacterium]|jgi:hypothetical protein
MIKQRVRSVALWAGIAAVLMLYFGYRTAFFSSSESERIAALILEYTLKVGGWGMAVSAAWLLTGMPRALLADAVASVAIGVCFVAGGLLYLFPSMSLVGILYPVFGIMFIGSGRNNWREYAALAPSTATEQTDRYDPQFEQRYAQAQETQPEGSLAGRLMQRTRDREHPAEESSPPPAPAATESAPFSPPLPSPVPQPDPDASQPGSSPAPEPASSEAADQEATPNGFLAHFAEKKDKPGESA